MVGYGDESLVVLTAVVDISSGRGVVSHAGDDGLEEVAIVLVVDDVVGPVGVHEESNGEGGGADGDSSGPGEEERGVRARPGGGGVRRAERLGGAVGSQGGGHLFLEVVGRGSGKSSMLALMEMVVVAIVVFVRRVAGGIVGDGTVVPGGGHGGAEDGEGAVFGGLDELWEGG